MPTSEQLLPWRQTRYTPRVKKGKVVTVEYSLFSETSGELIEYRDDLIYLHGIDSATLPHLQAALEGLGVDARREVLLSAADAYGEYDPELVVAEDPARLPDDVDSIGARVAGECANGEIIMFTVTHVDEDKVILDGNHRLAGVDLRFDVRIKDIRNASDQELAEGRAFRVERELPEPAATLH
ncbi:MAG TPA: peptidylprolyl isomerase [Gammaproteobacteria bacterium]|nr:peptidylprolyl isomerase [Gammaproteobacteria bacterium]